MLTLVPKKHYTKVIGGKRFYWSLEQFTKKEAELECIHLLSDFARMRLDGHKLWSGSPLHRLQLQQTLGIGPFKLAGAAPSQKAPEAPEAPQSTLAAPAAPTDTLAVGPHLTIGELAGLYLSEMTGLTRRKQSELRNKLKATKDFFGDIQVGNSTENHKRGTYPSA